jgi:hypothetical protein
MVKVMSEIETPTGTIKRRSLAPLVFVLIVCILPIAFGFVYVGYPAAGALKGDPRNETFVMRSRLGYFVNPKVLVIDLRRAESAAPADLARGLFTIAGTMHEKGREFSTVVLSAKGAPVFVITGSDFSTIGADWQNDENPVYMVRTLPSKLNDLDGTPAYGSWEGGIFGVLKEEMEDVTDSMLKWAGPTLPRP